MGYLKEKYTKQYLLRENSDGSTAHCGIIGVEEFKKGEIRDNDRMLLERIDFVDKNVLEIGFGRGEAIKYVLDHKAKHVTAIDFSEESKMIAEEMLVKFNLSSNATILAADALVYFQGLKKRDDKSVYDIIIMLDVVEHIPREELSKLLTMLRDFLSEKSVFIINTPVFRVDNDVIKDGLNPKSLDESDEFEETSGMHCNRYTYDSLINFFHQHSLNAVSGHYYINDDSIRVENADTKESWQYAYQHGYPFKSEWQQEKYEYSFSSKDYIFIHEGEQEQNLLTTDDYDFKNVRLIHFDGFSMFITPRFENFYIPGKFEEFTSDVIEYLLPEKGVFIDVGAHFGYYSFLASKKVGEHGSVFSFEPVKENHYLFEKNTIFNECANIKIFNAAVSNEKSIKSFQVTAASDSAGFHKHPLTETVAFRDIETYSLDSIFADKRVDMIKIDTEGHESWVLDGMKGVIRNNEDLKLIIEFNPKCLRASNTNPNDFLKKVSELGFDIFFIKDKERQFYKLDPFNTDENIWTRILGDKEYANLLCTKKGRNTFVSLISHSIDGGGAEQSLVDTARALLQKNYLVDIVLPAAKGSWLQQELRRLPVSISYHLNWWWLDNSNESFESLQRNIVKTTDELTSHLAVVNPDVICTNTSVISEGAFVSMQLQKPHVWYIHEFGLTEYSIHYAVPEEQRKRFINNASAEIIFVSNMLKESYHEYLSDEKGIVIYNTFYDTKEQCGPYVNVINRDFTKTDTLKIAVIGNINPGKNQKDIIDAVIEMYKHGRAVELYVIGNAEGLYAHEIRKKIELNNANDAFIFIKYVNTLSSFLQEKIDVVVSCSLGEAFGRTIFESMALSKPVIVANSEGLAELVTEDRGFLYTPGKPQEIIDILEKYFFDFGSHELVQQKVRNATGFVSSHAFDKYTEKIHSVFQKAINRYVEGLHILPLMYSSTTLKMSLLNEMKEQVSNECEKNTALLDDKIQKAHTDIQKLEQEIALMKNSKFWKLRNIYMKKSFFLGSNKMVRKARGVLQKHGYRTVLWASWKYLRYGRSYFSHGIESKLASGLIHAETDYDKWIREVEPSTITKNIYVTGPKISIITPTYNTDVEMLNKCIMSVVQQTYSHWELCIFDDCSTNEATKACLRKWQDKDSRIKVGFGVENAHISGASNKALEMVTGDFIALLDHDDTLPKHALNEVVDVLSHDETIDFIYTDKDKIDESDNRFDPLFKPDWSPEMMYSANYLTHLNVMRTDVVKNIEGWNEKTNGAQDWDLFLRVVEKSRKIKHISKVLYHWRVHKMSTSSSMESKPYAIASQELTLNEHFSRSGIDAAAHITPYGEVSIEWLHNTVVPFSVLVLAENLRSAAVFLENNKQVFQVDDIQHVYVYVRKVTENDDAVLTFQNHKVIYADDKSFFEVLSLIYSDQTKRIVCLSDMISTVNTDDLKTLCHWASLEGVGIVGGAVLDSSNRILDIGKICDSQSFSKHLFRGLFFGQASLLGHTNWMRNLNIVSRDIFVIDSKVLDSMSQMNLSSVPEDDDYINDLMLSCRKFGYRNIFCSAVQVRSRINLESLQTSTGVLKKKTISLYHGFIPDGYFNLNLDSSNEIPSLEISKNGIDERVYDDIQSELVLLDSYDINLHTIRSYHWPIDSNKAVEKVLFILPTFDSVYAGIFNILHFAESLHEKRVEVTLGVLDTNQDSIDSMKRLIKQYKPKLAQVPVKIVYSYKDSLEEEFDLGIATLWTTAYVLLKMNIRKKAYFIQDNEPLFYTGTLKAFTEETYRFGFFAIANTTGLLDMYKTNYAGEGVVVPSKVDLSRYKPQSRSLKSPYKVFFYGRPNNPRNAFSLALASMRILKEKYGNSIEIYAAGAEWSEAQFGVSGIIKNLGKIPFDNLATFYQSMDVGLMFMFSGHPGVVASELMASGVPVVVNDSDDSTWDELYIDRKTCLLAKATPSSVAHAIDELLTDMPLREKIIKEALQTVNIYYNSYDEKLTEACKHLLN